MGVKLFKYCSINDYTIENLKNNQLYFNIAKKYNDPYEGIFDFDIKDEELKDKIIRMSYTEELYDKVANNGNTLDYIIQWIRQSIINEFLDGNVKLCCMSYINDSLLMWAHYADSHRGICIEYNFGNYMIENIKDVNYSDDIYKICVEKIEDLSSDSLQKVGMEVISTKFSDWSYEKECRIFSENDIQKYNPSEIVSIYFGLRTSNQDIERIKQIFKGRTIKYYKADLEFNSYKMIFRQIS